MKTVADADADFADLTNDVLFLYTTYIKMIF